MWLAFLPSVGGRRLEYSYQGMEEKSLPYIKEHNIVSNYITLMARFIIMFNRWSLVLFECWTITSDVISHILKWGDCNKFVLFCLLISDVISRILKWGDCNKFVYFVYLYLTSSVVYWSREIAKNLFILFTYIWRHQWDI